MGAQHLSPEVDQGLDQGGKDLGLDVKTASSGLDDFEWGVTLFAKSPEVVKNVVYTMRFDEASALFGEFGDFYVGYLDYIENMI